MWAPCSVISYCDLMSAGWQELIALGIVILVVGFALYRRLRKPAAESTCHTSSEADDEKTVHFYRRDSR